MKNEGLPTLKRASLNTAPVSTAVIVKLYDCLLLIWITVWRTISVNNVTFKNTSCEFATLHVEGKGFFVQTLTFVSPQGEQGEAGNPGQPGEAGTGVSEIVCESGYVLQE